MQSLDLAQFLAFVCAMCAIAFGLVPNLFWFNWPGIICAVAGAILAYNFPGGAPYWAFFGVVCAWFFFARTRVRNS